ncbi:MAG: GxxExxY protein [Spirochaetales bacterium]|nr:GxxExxY protein [Spirochaetales bacterium]
MSEIIYKELSDKVIGIAFNVHNHLGPGLLESAYQGAFCVGLSHAGIPFECQKPYELHFLGEKIGAYVADLVVDNCLIIELKSVTQLLPVMEAQLINYLRISGVKVGYLINFHNTVLIFRRFVCTRNSAAFHNRQPYWNGSV